MIDTNAISCDVCGMPKGETNHWLVAVIVPPVDDNPEEVCIAFAPISAELSKPEEMLDRQVEHICGHACAVKRFSQWLETLTPLPTKGTAE